MNLQTMNGTAVITNLQKERTEKEVPVYNFRVSGWSSYFVSEWNVYVHNGEGYKKGHSKGLKVLKETETFIDYINKFGTTIRIPKQSATSIIDSINIKLKSTDVGTRIEAKVADYIRVNTKVKITDFGNKVKTPKGNILGDIDVATENYLIEVKASISSVKEKQLYKYVQDSHNAYLNTANKKVILYIDDEVDLNDINNVKLIKKIEDMGIIIINDLKKLKGVID